MNSAAHMLDKQLGYGEAGRVFAHGLDNTHLYYTVIPQHERICVCGAVACKHFLINIFN